MSDFWYQVSFFPPLILLKGFWSVENDKYLFQRNDEKHIIEHKIKNFKFYLSQPIRKNIYKNVLFRISQIHDILFLKRDT